MSEDLSTPRVVVLLANRVILCSVVILELTRVRLKSSAILILKYLQEGGLYSDPVRGILKVRETGKNSGTQKEITMSVRQFDVTLKYTVELRKMEHVTNWKPAWYACVTVHSGPLNSSIQHTTDLAMTMHHLVTEVLPPFLMRLKLAFA